MIQKREFFFFEWMFIDNCNLNCRYCVMKGSASQKKKHEMMYVAGKEIEIANKIVELSNYAERVVVNLTGGEPLLSEYFSDVLSILAPVRNITLRIVTNLKLIDTWIDDIERIYPSIHIQGSLHINYRSDEEIRNLISLLKKYKNRLLINLSQVDYSLTEIDNQKINRIKELTGYSVSLQPFIPPRTTSGRIENEAEVLAANFVSSIGKRCCLGYSNFLILPDGNFTYDLWCNENTRQKSDFLSLSSANFSEYILNDMKKCPNKHCGCNYNVFYYDEYEAECKKRAYPIEEIFGPDNNKIIEHLSNDSENIEILTLKNRIHALESSWSWRITRPLRLLSDWLR